MTIASLLQARSDSDLARLARVLVPLVLSKSWTEAQRVVTLWKKIVAADQSWYWTPEWQAAEKQAATELANGEFDEFDSMEKLIADFRS